jgi:hypothetical protein
VIPTMVHPEQQKRATGVCAKCGDEKDQEGFYKKQWAKSGSGKGVCISCSGGNSNKKRVIERICSICKCKFQGSNSGKKKGGPLKCDSCLEKSIAAQRERELKQKPLYFKTFGVGYQDVPSLQRREMLSNEDLVGKYKLVFYSSLTEMKECIHRTARGSMTLSVKEWAGIPALHGEYRLNTESSCRIQNEKEYSWDDDAFEPWGEDTCGAFIEAVTESKSYTRRSNGFNIFSNPGENAKLFVLDRNAASGDWWEEIGVGNSDPDGVGNSDSEEEESEDECDDDLDQWCGASLEIVRERVALGLESDILHGIEYKPNTNGIVPNTNGNHADEMMSMYRDGSNSWTCKHFGVAPDVAFRMREFVTPPPVFFVEPGDLVLTVEESKECEWQKQLVFRKEA